MSRGVRAGTAVLVAALALTACGSAAVSEYARCDAAAARAYTAGRYAEAAHFWDEAARAATTVRNRGEARYREASSLARGGRTAEAVSVLDTLLRENPRGSRAPRAAYDRATLLIASGETDRGYAALEASFRAYPSSGVAAAALSRYLAFVGAAGESKIQAYLDGVIPRLERTELGQYLHYAYAESLEREGKLEPARARYLSVARKYPYPEGSLWDDALFRAALLDAKLGDPHAAITDLEEMLAHRETSYMNGSYERGRYAEARFKIAELYRDALDDPERARTMFETLFSEHTTSRLRDDAAWNAALLSIRLGDRKGACRDLEALVTAMPDSRFAACAPRLCPSVKAGGECHEYILDSKARSAEPLPRR